jgi:YkoY family integral membrane protein
MRHEGLMAPTNTKRRTENINHNKKGTKTMLDKFVADFAAIGLQGLGVIGAVGVMDAALSADNSIAINAMAKDLPDHKRNKAIWLGMTFAAVLRLIALCLAAWIIANPWVQILGGLYLIKLCVDHYRKEKVEDEMGHKVHASMLSVLLSIGILDLSLSLDNVIAVVAMTSNLAVIVIGVLMSIAMLAVATQVTRAVMKRYPLLEDAAYVILAFLGVVMLIEHASEFLVWLGDIITSHHEFLSKLHVHVGEVGSVIGVAFIVITAIVIEETKKRKGSKALASSAE